MEECKQSRMGWLYFSPSRRVAISDAVKHAHRRLALSIAGLAEYVRRVRCRAPFNRRIKAAPNWASPNQGTHSLATARNSVYCVNHFFANLDHMERSLMRKITAILAAALLTLGSTTLMTNAQTQGPLASSLNAQAQNATIIHKASCRGWGGCGPGWHRVCGPYRCWCAPC